MTTKTSAPVRIRLPRWRPYRWRKTEVQLGKMFSPSFGVYMDGLFGIGGDRPYDWGLGVGLRFNY